MMRGKILVIDDDPGLIKLMELGLEREGFTVIAAESGKDGLRQAYEQRPDLIILDIMMPEMDGWTTCQRLRNVCDTPIIILTAKSGDNGVLKGLSLGADDYLCKPCSFDELKARIHANLRRARVGAQGAWRSVYDDGELHIDLMDGEVALRGEPIHLTATESRLLMYLVNQKGRVVPHKELLTSVWGPTCAEETGYLSVYVRYLRQKIEDDPANPRYIRTRWGMGYYFAGDGEFRSERAMDVRGAGLS